MFRRRTSKVRKRRQVRVLRANVMSPRIFWYDFRRSLFSAFRMLLVAGGVAGAGWGIWLAIERGLIDHDDFRLREIVLNENPVMDEIRMLEVAGIDPSGSLFDCDPAEIEAALAALPEVAVAKVIKEYPGTLKVSVLPRQPAFWVACESAGIAARDRDEGLLVDGSNFAFPCSPGLFEQAKLLPVIELREGGAVPVAGERLEHPDLTRGRRLFAAVREAIPDAAVWIDSIRQYKGWASVLRTRDGMEAVFGHEDLNRQMSDLLAELEHARDKGDRIATIHLIGRRNHPVTLHEPGIPRAIIVEEPVLIEDEPEEPAGDDDLQELLRR